MPHSRRPAARSAGIGLGGENPAVAHDRLVRRAVELELPLPQQHRALAEPLDLGRVVRDEDDRAAPLLELEHLAEALPLERLVADREHLVEQEHVRVEVRRDREAEPHVHPRGVRTHGPVDRLLELGERDDLVEALADLRALEPVDRAVQEDVLATGEVGVEAGAELEQRADPSADGDAALGRLDDPGDQPQQGRLAGAVAADEADRLARLDAERDVLEREHIACLGSPAEHEQLLQASRLVRPDAEATRDPLDADLPRLHPRDGTAKCRRTSPASTSMNAGSAFGSSIRSNRIPSCLALSAASMSRSQRISRWSATNPIGQTTTSRTSQAASSLRCSRMSGPSHGSPVGDWL